MPHKRTVNARDKGKTAFIITSFAYRPGGREKPLSQRDVAKRIAAFSEVQEVHIITGGWDILVKVKADHADILRRLVMDKLRTVEGIENTLSCIVYETVKKPPTYSPENMRVHFPISRDKDLTNIQNGV